MDVGLAIGIIGLILGLVGQTVAIVWFFSRLNSRVENLEVKSAENKEVDTPNRLLKVEFRLEMLQTSTDEQSLKLDKVIDGQTRAEAERHVLVNLIKKDLRHEDTLDR